MKFERTETDENVHIHASATIFKFFEYALRAAVIVWVVAGLFFDKHA
ncbi:MAG: hypothetical protein RL755_33 [Pseudomonadota bacterium]|jgi:hypothetical protein